MAAVTERFAVSHDLPGDSSLREESWTGSSNNPATGRGSVLLYPCEGRSFTSWTCGAPLVFPIGALTDGGAVVMVLQSEASSSRTGLAAGQ